MITRRCQGLLVYTPITSSPWPQCQLHRLGNDACQSTRRGQKSHTQVYRTGSARGTADVIYTKVWKVRGRKWFSAAVRPRQRQELGKWSLKKDTHYWFWFWSLLYHSLWWLFTLKTNMILQLCNWTVQKGLSICTTSGLYKIKSSQQTGLHIGDVTKAVMRFLPLRHASLSHQNLVFTEEQFIPLKITLEVP